MADRHFFTKESGGFIENWLLSKVSPIKIENEKFSNWRKIYVKKGELKNDFDDLDNFLLGVYIFTPIQRSGVLYLDAWGVELQQFSLNAKSIKVSRENALCLYRSEIPSIDGLVFDFPVTLEAGWNKLIISCQIQKGTNRPNHCGDNNIIHARFMGDDGFIMKNIVVSTQKTDIATQKESKISTIENDVIVGQLKQFPLPQFKKNPPVATDGYRLGTGNKKRSIGRFGFTKGDGLLDYAMPYLGVIDKMYLFGHPDYGKLSRWMISMIPPGISPYERWRGMLQRGKSSGHENDAINTKWLSSSWKTVYNTVESFYERPKGQKIIFSCTYSLGTPGVLIETDDPALSLQNLQTISSFKNIILPLKDGIIKRNTEKGGVIFDSTKDGDLTDNWVLIYGAKAFPDIPVLIILQKKPKEIIFVRNCENNLERIDIHTPPSINSAIIMTPFGIESFKPEDTRNNEWIKKAVKNAILWSKRSLAFPVDCEEHYKINEEKEYIDILQSFSYRILKDEWNSAPLMTAPLPPALTLLEGKDFVKLPPNTEDFHFPTKYGYLKGVYGQNQIAYRIPMLQLNRKFPLKPTGDKDITEELAEEMQSYLDFHDSFEDLDLSYCTPACFVNKYSHPLALFNFLKPEFRTALEARAKKAINYASNVDTSFTCAYCDFKRLLYDVPEADEVLDIYKKQPQGKECFAWYPRKEPFSGEEYLACYINVNIINHVLKNGSREEVLNYPVALIENDWGAGLTFYGIYLLALETGEWDIIKKNWETLKKGFKYFFMMHDWACMGGPFSENGAIWQEGANYGAFIGMTQMAKMIEDRETYLDCLYISSKSAFLKMATFVSAQTYFYKYFSHDPWWGKKFFHDEAHLQEGFNNVPVPELKNNVTQESLYNLSTEGLYPEIFMLLNKYLPGEFYEFRDKLLQSYPDWYKVNEAKSCWYGDKDSLGLQSVFSLCLMSALDNNYDQDLLLNQLDMAAKNGRFPLSWFGLHIPDRHIPKNTLKCYIKILIKSRNYPIWLEEWKNVKILKAEYDAKNKKVNIEYNSNCEGYIIFGFNYKPEILELNGILLSEKHWQYIGNSKLKIPAHSKYSNRPHHDKT
jgi:hypothetical protein